MFVTAFISMWISNTATAALMLPISHAVLLEFKQQNNTSAANIENCSAHYSKSYDDTTESSIETVHITDTSSSSDDYSTTTKEENM